MTKTKVQKSGSWTPQIQKKAPSLAPPPIVVQRDPVSGETETHKPEYTPLEPNALENHPLMGDISDLPPIQTKLTIGAPGDKYEQEADTVARKVVQHINTPVAQRDMSGDIPTKTLSRQPVGRNIIVSPFAGMVQGKEAIGGGEASSEIESSINRAKGGGQSLDSGLQRSMGQAMGADFGGVKVHTDSQADTLNRSLSSRAFTTGNHLFFKRGEYNPGSQGGQELIAHELTHVMQQTGNTVQGKYELIQRAVEHQYPGLGSWDEVHAGAEAAMVDLTAAAKELAANYSGKPIIPPLKGEERARYKVANDYAGNWNRLTDVARATVVFRTAYNLYAAQEYLIRSKWISGTEGTDWRVKNRYTEMPAADGYRDIKFNFRVSNDHVVELQLNCEAMIKAKDYGHAPYEIARMNAGDALTFDVASADAKIAEKARKDKNKMIHHFEELALLMGTLDREDLSDFCEVICDEIAATNAVAITADKKEKATEAMELAYAEGDKEIKKRKVHVMSGLGDGHGESAMSIHSPDLT
jgi:hypothetical protein